MVDQEQFASVWDALEATPEDAARMKLCADLMLQMAAIVQENGWGVRAAAERLHTEPSRVTEMLEGRIDRFELDELVGMAGALGRKVRIEIEAA